MIQYLIFLRAQLIPKIVLGEGQIHRGWGCNRNGAVIIQKGCYSTQKNYRSICRTQAKKILASFNVLSFKMLENNFLRKTLGVESPSINTSFSPFKLPPCIRSLQY
ncbi:transcription factor MYB88 [Trifolium repens]|nr:transcription factor MYB88 [Trifolium repens]